MTHLARHRYPAFGEPATEPVIVGRDKCDSNKRNQCQGADHSRTPFSLNKLQLLEAVKLALSENNLKEQMRKRRISKKSQQGKPLFSVIPLEAARTRPT